MIIRCLPLSKTVISMIYRLINVFHTIKIEDQDKKYSITELGLLIASYKFGENKLSLVGNNIYLTALLLLDLYNDNIIEFYILMDKDAHNQIIISLKQSEESIFQLLENVSQKALIQRLLLKPLRSRLPNNYPEPHKILYNEIIKLSKVYYDISYINVLDLLVSSQCDLFLNLTINDCKAFTIQSLIDKNVLLVSRKFYILFDYTLTEYGKKLAIFTAEQVNQYLQNNYVKEQAFYSQFDSEQMQKNIYTVSQLLLILSYSTVTKATKVSKETQKKAAATIDAVVNQLGNVVRSPDLKMQPANQEAWYVATICLMVKCMDLAIFKANQQ